MVVYKNTLKDLKKENLVILVLRSLQGDRDKQVIDTLGQCIDNLSSAIDNQAKLIRFWAICKYKINKNLSMLCIKNDYIISTTSRYKFMSASHGRMKWTIVLFHQLIMRWLGSHADRIL